MRPFVASVFAAILVLGTTLFPANAEELSFQGHFVQGGLVVGKTVPGSRVDVDGETVRVSPEGLFLMGFDRDADTAVTVDVTDPTGNSSVRMFPVEDREFDIQRIDGLPPKKVTPDPQLVKRIRAENALIHEVRAHDSAASFFRKPFIWPVHGRISGVFGSQRILNGKPRSPHSGIDIAAPPGTPVVACAGGTISLVHPDMFLTGKTVVIDHGHGLSSVYIHMSEIAVTEGQRVEQGDPVGRVGASGRATGPHLHWSLSLFQTKLDPALVVPEMPPGP